MRAGETEAAADAFQRQIRLDGSSTGIYNLACAYALGGETEAALEALERSLHEGYGDGEKLTSDPDLVSLHGHPDFDRLVRLADELELHTGSRWGDGRRAWRAELPRLERAARDHPSVGRAWFNLGYGQLRTGDADASRESFTRALELGHRRSTTMYNLACCAAQLRDRDAAFRWLERAEAAGMDLGWHVLGDEDLAPIRSDPRYRALERRIRSRWDDKHDRRSS
jgi:tetratricopeptide (TPR) repeat protein